MDKGEEGCPGPTWGRSDRLFQSLWERTESFALLLKNCGKTSRTGETSRRQFDTGMLFHPSQSHPI